jgi:hypothetical protein
MNDSSPPKARRDGSPPKVNWQAAKAYFLALPVERRTFKAVAERFKVSDVRVGQIAKRDRWGEDVLRLDEEQERATWSKLRRELRSRADRVARTLELYDRANDLALELLPVREDGSIDVEKLGAGAPTLEQILRRIPGLFRMAELAAGEATDRVQIADVQPVLSAFARIAVLEAAPERRAEVMRLLEAASAGLVALPSGEAA